METYGPANESRQFAGLSATWNISILHMLEGDITGSVLPSVWRWHRGCSDAALPLRISPCAPGLGRRNCKGEQDVCFSTWITLKSQAPVWFWLLFSPKEKKLDKMYGGTWHPGWKDLLQSPHQILCVWYKGKTWWSAADSTLPTETRSENWKALFKRIFLASFDGQVATIKTC